MDTPLLKTKLAVPLIRKNLVARQHLVERLNAGLGGENGFTRKLTLISAPAGFGKTTLAAVWLGAYGQRVAWLSLDDGDNDPARFTAYLIAALQQVDAQIGQAPLAMLRSPQPPPAEAVISTLINQLVEFSRPVFLVLDDFHVVQSPEVHRQVGFFLEHLPDSLHLVILTREDPPLPVARLRSHGQVVEIRERELRFSAPESADFLLRLMGLDLSGEDLDTLHWRTEGWVTGLQLAGLSMQGDPDQHRLVVSFAGNNRFILDYLFEETFSHLPVETQEFLIRTSILERLTAGLCDAVADRTDSGARLDTLERANLFIFPLDPVREWYRYHHLFADLLNHQLRLRSDISSQQLHTRASAWFESSGDLATAVGHALFAQDWPAAVRLIVSAGDAMLKHGEIASLLGWLRQIPTQALSNQPNLYLTYAWALLLASQFDEAAPLLEHVETLAPPDSAILGHVAAAQAYLARAQGDNRRLIEKSALALALLPETEVVSRGNVTLNLGLAFWHEGRLDEAERALLDAVDLCSRTGNQYACLAAQIFLARTAASRGELRQAAALIQGLLQNSSGAVPLYALAHYDLSTIFYEWNKLEDAAEQLRLGLEISTRTGNNEFQNSGEILGAFLALAQGNPTEALASVERSHRLGQDLSPATRSRSAACHVALALSLGDREMAAYWGEKVRDDVDAHSFYRFLGLTRPRLMLAAGQRQAAGTLLETAYQIASDAGWGYAQVAVRILQAQAAFSTPAALEFLADALRQAQAEGFIRAFADAGEILKPLLLETAQRGILPEYTGSILAAMGSGRRTVSAQIPGLVEPLSPRERDVLRLVTAGLTNREIAAKLVISPGTAKTHIHHICAKLDVRNRTEAALRAKELGLV